MKPLVACLAVLCCGVCLGQETRLLWGDTHLHTSYSTDAYSNGNYTADPDTAYRFARGLPVIHPATGQRVRIDRPLDFLVVADHAELLQLQVRLADRDPAWLDRPDSPRMFEALENDPAAIFREIVRIGYGGSEALLASYNLPDLRQLAWDTQVDVTESHNDHGTFTALIGWEWSPAPVPHMGNLHRVIFTPSNADVAKRFFPINYYDTVKPEELWAWLGTTSAETGAEFIAIPHNSNMSNGKMFDMVDSAGRPLTAQYTRTRMHWEPVMEVTQVKGSSETMPALSPDDPFADFEVRNRLLNGQPSAVSPGSYARGALRRGLELATGNRVNPYKLGFIGSSDAHTGMVSVDESNYMGKYLYDALPAQRARMTGGFPAWETSASGLAGVWATENTRDAIAAAFKRKEVYASSGPRISVRFFGGFNFTDGDGMNNDLSAIGYARGVPMGGDLTAAPAGGAPGFLVQVSKDPRGANLDRVQVIKGWLDANGDTFEKVYDVAWAGNCEPGPDGRVPVIGSTVDVETATYDNTIGSAQLATVWRDPDFNPDQPAFYYLRALEIPTPRHHVYDAVALGLDPGQIDLPPEIQERAWSSPIWYTP